MLYCVIEEFKNFWTIVRHVTSVDYRSYLFFIVTRDDIVSFIWNWNPALEKFSKQFFTATILRNKNALN